MESYKKLFSNSVIFAIGNLGSKLISFLLVPLYTYYLTVEEYGTIDIVTTTATMLIPLVSLSIYEAALRYALDKKISNKEILSNSIVISVVGSLIMILGIPLISHFFNIEYRSYLSLITIVQLFQMLLSQYIRGIGKIKLFAFNGIILTFTMAVLNIFFLVYLKMGISGYFISMIISYFVSIIFLITFSGEYKILFKFKLNIRLLKDMLNYSLPMIPNSLLWWLINASSRYFINFFVGIGANGIFAVASKIPALITVLSQVFSQAWQLSAIEEYDNNNVSSFYSNVFKYLYIFMFFGTFIINMIIKWLYFYLFSIEYYEGWKIVPFLLIGAVYSTFSGFVGVTYVASKETKGVLGTSIIGGLVSLLLNSILIPSFGLSGASISSAISFIIIFLYRYFDTKKFIKFSVKWKGFLINNLIILIQIAVVFSELYYMLELIINILLLFLMIFINKSDLKLMIQIIPKRPIFKKSSKKK